MASHVKLRKEKGGLAEYEAQIKELRGQLSDQLKVVDAQLEPKTLLLQDLCDYLRRRGEIEAEYARSLEKLTERLTARTKRKEQSEQSVAQCWQVLLNMTRQESRDHGAMSECYSYTLTQRLSHCMEDTQRLAKRSKEVGLQMQEDLLKVTSELQMALKTYHQYHTNSLAAEGKLREVAPLDDKQTGKSTDMSPSQSVGQRRSTVKKIERQIEKRQVKFQEAELKCTKARNDYLLNLAAANASMSKHYLQDICTLIDCTDLGYHLSISRVMQCYLSTHYQAQQNLKESLQQLDNAVSRLDQSQDRAFLLQSHKATFCLPFNFQYQPHEGDQVCEVSAEGQVKYELETRFQQLQTRLAAVTLETEEVSKTLRATYAALLESICDDDCGPAPEHGSVQPQEAGGDGAGSKPSLAKRRANQQETESYYFTKVKENLSGRSLISKLQVKHDLLKEAIKKAHFLSPPPVCVSRAQSNRSVRLRKARPCSQYSHKIFNGDMLSFIQSSGEQIPLVVASCIRFINLHGLHHEGIFRVPGSQSKVNLLKDAFERGEDPLTDSECDLDSVAGVLKLYFRGLQKPLFPMDSFSQLMECVQIDSETERAARIKSLVTSFPPPVIIVMRYLFAFLHHVSQYSDENMMQPYNLAVCFGPSLLRGSDTEDMVALQPQINALVTAMILQHESIFPSQAELQGPIYEKCMTLEQEYCEPVTEEVEGETEQLPSEDEWDAVAMFDYVARSPAELSFKQGDYFILHNRASVDWWRGEVGGVKGLIPDKYISVIDGSIRSKVEQAKAGSTGNLSVEPQTAEQSNRLRVNSDCGTIPSRQRGEGSTSSVRKMAEGKLFPPSYTPAHGQQPGAQERRITLENAKPMGTPDKETGSFDKEVTVQMNSVFKELLARQPLPDQVSSTSPSMSSGSNLSPSLLRPVQKKTGVGPEKLSNRIDRPSGK
ncbi:SLIT-ROBO Rho GTPase-activating protein 3-like [Arapaima gigas]